ncbi:zinc metallopeptidase [Herbivorax sp. ANBcel31]|uniref:zinc metallopeptidase n=1 Tax=Herbivorax sp. ANBcel31 TaxID=3069754 RepID=UPI0027B4C6B8|nr:zinc metallopeptidase [Herbivorax sp. ANBcel31]MDQ2087153.1 zinc metallopeptidase [Herbivorax sp. ANBcel31]
MLGFIFLDQYYILLVIPALVFSMYAQFKVKNTFGKYSKVSNKKGLTGADIARVILEKNGLNDVRIEKVGGELTDHYDPRTKVVRLSQVVHGSNSVAAIGVAAHETGHAIQHSVGYGPLVLRSTLVPVAGIGSNMGFPMAIVGLIFGWDPLIYIGIGAFSLAVLFYLVTLPVEFNASSRAIRTLEDTAILDYDEVDPAKKVLSAAAMTYVASAAVAIANLLRLVLLARRR